VNFRKNFQAAALLPSLALGGCLSTLLGTKEQRSDDYSIPALGSGWESIDPAEADAAYRNQRDLSILNISSICGQDRFRSLEELTSDILRQLPEATTVGQATAMPIAGFPGMVTDAQGQVDGKPLMVRLAVIRAPKCLYDIILAGKVFDSTSLSAFDSVLQGFKIRSER
jgi:hypothetical protein